MRCHQCGCDNSETVRTCPGCGVALTSGSHTAAAPRLAWVGPEQVLSPAATMEQALGYATMGERFLAFVCDASVATVLEGAFLALFYSKSSLDFERLKAIALWVIPIAYMTLAEFFFHRTIGKRLLRIQVRSDSPEPRYPSLFSILVRESVGNFLCGLVFGIGFLAAGWNPKKKTWADRMANTVVVKTGVASGRLKAVLAPILICANVALGIALTEIPLRYKKTLAYQLTTTEGKIDGLHLQIFLAFFTREPRTAKEYQQKVTALLSTLDEYDRLLLEEQETVRRSRKLARFEYENLRLNPYEQIIGCRQEISALVRTHVEMVLAFDPQKQTWNELLRNRRQMMDDINRRNNQINQIGGPYVPRKFSFTD